MKKIGIIIYARSNSKRLPNKVLKEINNKSLLEIVYSRVKKKSENIPIIVNTSKNKSDNKIVRFCKKNKINFFRGNLNNVIDSTIKCCKKFELNSFVRVNADRPYWDFKLMFKMINLYLSKNFDIVTNQHPKNFPRGLACEIASTKIFYDLKMKKLSKSEKEHIFNYFYKNSYKYKILNYKDKFYKKVRRINLSVDSNKDFSKLEKIYQKIGSKKFITFDTKKLVREYIVKN